MVNGVSFQSKMGVFDSAADVIDKPQAQTRPSATQMATQPDTVEVSGKKKKSSTGKIIAGIIGTAVAVAGALALGKHFNVFNVEKLAEVTKSFKDKSWISWAKKPVKTVMNALDTAGDYILKKGKSAYNCVAGWFGKGEATKEAGQEAAQEVASILAK